MKLTREPSFLALVFDNAQTKEEERAKFLISGGINFPN
jgi:hypothetical protein